MPNVLILRGLQASGKTTWAKKQVKKGNTTRINKDDLRAMMHGSGEPTDVGFRRSLEGFILDVRDGTMIKALRRGRNVIIDDTNFAKKHEDRIREVCEAQGQIDGAKYTVKVKSFPIELNEAIRRDATRSKPVGERVIRQTYNQYIRPLKAVVQDENKPQAIICDMDGTLSLMNGRNPYDASECEYDLLNKPVLDAIMKYQKDGYKLLILSGRSGQYQEQTDNWLKKHYVKPDFFAMRKEGDIRKDWIVKQEIFMEHILPNYKVEVVFDDRNQVVDMWRDLGLTVFQVNEGNF